MSSDAGRYKISLSKSGKYVVTKVSGTVNAELAYKFGIDADAYGKKHDVFRFLFDVRNAPNTEKMTRNFNFAYEVMPATELSHYSRSAILTDPDDSSHDFMETLLKNAGYNVKLFKEEKTAIAWLEQ